MKPTFLYVAAVLLLVASNAIAVVDARTPVSSIAYAYSGPTTPIQTPSVGSVSPSTTAAGISESSLSALFPSSYDADGVVVLPASAVAAKSVRFASPLIDGYDFPETADSVDGDAHPLAPGTKSHSTAADNNQGGKFKCRRSALRTKPLPSILAAFDSSARDATHPFEPTEPDPNPSGPSSKSEGGWSIPQSHALAMVCALTLYVAGISA